MRWRYPVPLCLVALGTAWSQAWIHPFPVGSVANQRPSVGAYLAPEIQATQFLVDGRDLTAALTQQSGRLSWAPDYDLDGGRHIALLQGRTRTGQTVSRSWSFTIGEGPSLEVINFTPSPNAAAAATPRISARLSAPVHKARLLVDGREVRAQVSQNQITYQPPLPLKAGTHKVFLFALGLDGSMLEKSWTFASGRASAPAASSPVVATASRALFNLRSPLPGQFTSSRPAIRIRFQEGLYPTNLLVDNLDLTASAQSTNGEFNWQPDYEVNVGPHQIQVRGRRANGTEITENWTFYVVREGAQFTSLNALLPSDGVRETPNVHVQPVGPTISRPTIAFALPEGKAQKRFVLVVDGVDLSGQADLQGSRLQWTPPYDLDRGNHSVSVICQGTDGKIYSRNWNFEVR